MRTVNDCRKELEDIDKLIKEKETEINIISEGILKLKGVKSGIIWTLLSKKEKKDAVLQPRP